MSIVKTDLRNTRERAKEIRFYPAGIFTATNVQDAIEQSALGLAPTPTPVDFAMSPYTPLSTDTLLLVDSSGGSVVINMPLSAERSVNLEVKDGSGDSVANPITVNATAPEEIDGQASYVIDTAFAAANFGPKTGGYYVHA